MLSYTSAIGEVVTLSCEGKQVVPGTDGRAYRYSIAFDESRSFLTMNGEPFKFNKQIDAQQIVGSNFLAVGRDPNVGMEHEMRINRVTADFTFGSVPTTRDGSRMTREQAVQLDRDLGGGGIFMIKGLCTKARQAF
jgi:hypothetical protein